MRFAQLCSAFWPDDDVDGKPLDIINYVVIKTDIKKQ